MLNLRWLGVAGIELTWSGQVLLVDPYVTRIPFWRQWAGAITSNRILVREMMPYARAVLVTHAHYDHLLDVPEVLTHTGALGVGSANTCQILACLGVPFEQIQCIKVDEEIELGPFQVTALLVKHAWTPGFTPGPLRSGLKEPMTARDYRMDECYSFLVKVGGLSLLVAAGEMQAQAPHVDVLFANPAYTYARDPLFLGQVKPALIIPVHWDNFWLPLTKPIRSMLQPPRWAAPYRRIDLQQFQQTLKSAAPGAQVCVLERFSNYALQRRPGSTSVAITCKD